MKFIISQILYASVKNAIQQNSKRFHSYILTNIHYLINNKNHLKIDKSLSKEDAFHAFLKTHCVRKYNPKLKMVMVTDKMWSWPANKLQMYAICNNKSATKILQEFENSLSCNIIIKCLPENIECMMSEDYTTHKTHQEIIDKYQLNDNNRYIEFFKEFVHNKCINRKIIHEQYEKYKMSNESINEFVFNNCIMSLKFVCNMINMSNEETEKELQSFESSVSLTVALFNSFSSPYDEYINYLSIVINQLIKNKNNKFKTPLFVDK